MDHQALLTKANIEHMFQLFDSDKDGFITMSELKKVFSTSRQNNPESDYFLLDVLRDVDVDGNHKISFEEFQ